jgi:hypothetical protein
VHTTVLFTDFSTRTTSTWRDTLVIWTTYWPQYSIQTHRSLQPRTYASQRCERQPRQAVIIGSSNNSATVPNASANRSSDSLIMWSKSSHHPPLMSAVFLQRPGSYGPYAHPGVPFPSQQLPPNLVNSAANFLRYDVTMLQCQLFYFHRQSLDFDVKISQATISVLCLHVDFPVFSCNFYPAVLVVLIA